MSSWWPLLRGTRTGNMPPKLLAGAEAEPVAGYVAKVAGGGGQ